MLGKLNDTRARVILLDIEGTTTPIAFVHETLFGYASMNLEVFLRENIAVPEVSSCIEDMRMQHGDDVKNGRDPPPWPESSALTDIDPAVSYGLWLISIDSKLPALKRLQGLMWEHGYRTGELKSQVYEDVPDALRRWKSLGKEICIYSSGSAFAQRLIFGATQYGDLTIHIGGFFDTGVGTKTNPDSYRKIASLMGVPESGFLFFSDVGRELDAAKEAGMGVCLVSRSQTVSQPVSGYPVIGSFREIE
ncbi:MAG: acireductone synthase [Candidatus Thermoplasmatota archaeon]|nr:acireductone synthase [Candidatus Thermoplasmatota archaeon]